MIENNIQLELVLVDDCSKDKSLELAEKLAKNYNEVKVFSPAAMSSACQLPSRK